MLDIKPFLGINVAEIRKTCVICPVSDHSLFAKLGKSKRQNLFFARIMNYDKITVISTKNNFLVGDIVLALKNSLCENIILFGSCGGIGDVKIADKLIVKKVFNFESFSEMLEMKRNPDVYYPSITLSEKFLSKTNLQFEQIKSVTTNSIILERTYKDWFDKNKINAVDMECSSVFSAASAINKKAIALLYVTDSVSVADPFEFELDEEQKAKLLKVRQEIADAICDFANNE